MSTERPAWTVRCTVSTRPRPRAHQNDLAELRRCANPACGRVGVLMVQRWNSDAQKYECACCGQFDMGWR